MASLRGLFELIEWIDYCYGNDYVERTFDEKEIPKEKVVVDIKKIKAQESLLEEKDAEIEKLRKQIEKMADKLTAQKEVHKKQRTFTSEDLSEFATRKQYIDVDLKELGWQFRGDASDVWEEYPVNDMTGVVGQKGYVDYVLFGKDGLPLALIEAKRTSKDPNSGRKQAMLYADCLERKFGRRPMMFTSNGFETYFWDDISSPQRQVSGMFSKGDLQKLMNRRSEKKVLSSIPIDDKITDCYYQKEAIRAVCDHVEQGYRKNLLVMATGTGKTRTAASLTDVDRNTYDFFEMEHGVPTYAYDYETAVYTDHVLVPYYTYIVKTEFLNNGITYEKLSKADKERFEDDFEEDGDWPDFIPSQALNKFVFNELTVDRVLQDLMERGIKVAGGDRIGKTIIFAQNKKYVEFILQRFNKLYPKYNGTFIERVIYHKKYTDKVVKVDVQ